MKTLIKILLIISFFAGLNFRYQISYSDEPKGKSEKGKGKVKCPYCGYLNEPEDRYCVNCMKEIRPLTKEEKKKIYEERKQIVISSYKKAKENFFKAKQTLDRSREKFHYELAVMYADRALTEGKDGLTSRALAELKKIKWISKERLKVLRQIIKNPQSRVKLKKVGRNYYIEVLLNNKITAKLHLDTGCSTTLISKKIADKLSIKGGEKVKAVLANGDKVEGKKAFMKSIKAGDQIVENVPIMILDIPNDGLLGMSFLRNFIFQVDTERNELILERR